MIKKGTRYCELCGGTAGELNHTDDHDAVHELCAARYRYGLPTPSEGGTCEACNGLGVQTSQCVACRGTGRVSGR